MPRLTKTAPKYTPSKDFEVEYKSFNGGWNNLFKPTELKPTELAQADNLMLIGAGTPTGRWGSAIYSLPGDSGKIRMLDAYYNSLTSTNYLLAITDQGYLTRQNGASYTIIPGASFPSGANYYFTQMGNKGYINGPSTNFVRLSGTSLIPYIALSNPTNASIAQLSAASGFATYSWIITALSQTGENLGSIPKSFASLPLDLTLTSMKFSWNTVSAASGTLTGYNIYRGFPGDETYIASVDPASTQYIDTGIAQSNVVFPPTADTTTADTTTGPRARFRLKFDDRIVLAGLDGDPNRVLISARYPYHDRFNAADGGGSLLVGPDDGDDITGLGIAGNQGMSSGGSAPPSSSILVMKNNSVHRVVLTQVTVGNFLVLDPQSQLLTSSNGCSSVDTVQPVENDTFYFGRKGLYTVGQEPAYLNQIRTNELSARIRPYIRNLSDADFKGVCAGYIDNKYILSFLDLKETIIYDRERMAFMGPWKTPWGINKWFKYFDNGGVEKWLTGTTTGPYIRDFSTGYISDSGTAIAKVMRTRKEDLGSWSTMKILKYFYFLLRNVTGTVTINLRIEDRTGSTVTTKSATITSALGSGGWGNDQWGDQQWGQSDATVTFTGEELARFAQIYKQCRVIQVEVTTSAANENFEFLAARFTAQPLGDTSLPAADRV